MINCEWLLPRDPILRKQENHRVRPARQWTAWLFISAALAFHVALPSRAIAMPDNFDKVFSQADANYRQGNYKEALKLFKKANSINKNNFECLFLLSRTYTKIGDHKNALKTCDELIQISSAKTAQLAKAWNLRGNALFDAAMDDPLGAYEIRLRQAESGLREALKINPNLNLAHYNLGIALIRMNRMNEGLSELRAYLSNATEPDIAEKARALINASKMPIPVLEVVQSHEQPWLNGYRLAIILKIKNWTDFAAELLRSDAELPACFMGGGNSRLEITVISDYEPYSPPMCNITEPAGLRNITVFYAFSGKTDPRASKMKEVYVRLKDRLTGYSVFSQPVALP